MNSDQKKLKHFLYLVDYFKDEGDKNNKVRENTECGLYRMEKTSM